MEKKNDIQEILNFLPHRYPFLLVDRVLEVVPGEKIIAQKNVTINEPFFQGHFPDAPVMPGVLIIEAMAQAGGILALTEHFKEQHGYLFYFMGIDKAKFRKPVVPGDCLILEAKIIQARSKAVKLSATANVDGKLVAEAVLMATIGEKP